MKRSAINRRSAGALALIAALSVSAVAGDAAVIRTPKLEFTGIAAGAETGKAILRTQKLEFTGTNSGGER